MNRLLIILAAVFQFLVVFNLTAQNIDSLYRVANVAKNDSVKAKLYCELANSYYDINADSAKYYYQRGIELYLKSENDTLAFNPLINLSLLYINNSEFSEAKGYLLQCLDIATRSNDSLKIATAHSELGSLYYQINSDSKAIFHLKEASQFINPSMNPNLAGKFQGRLGNFYLINKNYPEAEESYQKAIEYFNMAKNVKGIIIATQNLGIIEKNRKNYDKAIQFYNQALKSYESINYEAGVGQCLANIGNIYEEKRLYDKALRYHYDALKIFKQEHQLVDEMLSYGDIANAYDKQERSALALETISKTFNFLDSFPENEKLKLSLLYEIQRIYKNAGNTDKAYSYLLRYQALNDTIHEQDSRDLIDKYRIQYEVDQKEKDIKLLTYENELKEAKLKRKNVYQIFYIVTIGLSVLIILSLFNLIRIKKKANRELSQKNAEILLQKEEIETQRDEIEAQKEEIEAQRDDLEVQKTIAINQRDEIISQKKSITDSINYAKHIQRALFPNNQEVNAAIKTGFVFFRPLNIVSGDFYWVHHFGSKSIIAVADCTGHGVPGAMMSVLGINFLHSIIVEKQIYDPGTILTKLNDSVIDALSHTDERLQDRDGMDISLCCIDFDSLTLKYACAKNKILVCRNQDILQLDAEKYSIGKSPFIDKIVFSTLEFKLNRLDMLYFMTDGYIDQFGGPNNGKFLLSRFKNVIGGIASTDMENQKRVLGEIINEWQSNSSQIDDMLIVGIRID